MSINRGKKVRRLKAHKKLMALEKGDWVKLKACLDSKLDVRSALIEVILQTGCRLEEACRIDKEDVQRAKENEGRLYIDPAKGSEERFVPVTSKLLDKLETASRFVSDSMPIAQACSKTRSEDIKAWMRALQRYFDKIQIEIFGVKKYHPHQLRHSWAMLALEATDRDVMAVKEMMGHKSINSTSIYLRSIETKDALAKMKKLVG